MSRGGPSPEEMKELVTHLLNTRSPDPRLRKPAEAYLLDKERLPGFGPIVLSLLGSSEVNDQIKHSAAIILKNFIRKYYGCEEQIISVKDSNKMKEDVIEIMLISPKLIQSQMCESITLIANKDFYKKWPHLLPGLVEKLGNNAFRANVGVLKIIESITAKYVNKERTHVMVDEIKYVLREFGPTWLRALEEWRKPICTLFNVASNEPTPRDDKDVGRIKAHVECLELLVRIFYDLICVDFIEFFDNTKDDWMQYLRDLVQIVDKHRIFGTSDLESAFERLLTNIVISLKKLVQDYDDDIQKYVAVFVELVSKMLSQIDENSRYDSLVAESIQFLNVVCRQRWHQRLFDDDKRLNDIVKHILIRNIRLRETDMNMYETGCEDWVLRDMEGSDLYTRRRGAVDLGRSLVTHFEERVSEIVLTHVRTMTTEYSKDKANNFVAMDAAINLMLAISVRAKTQALGATQVNTKLPVMDFFQKWIYPELKENSAAHNIIRADALKFIVMFRSQWNQQNFMELLPLACKFLAVDDYVLHTYAAIAIDKILSLRLVDKKRAEKRTTHGYKYPKEQLLQHVPRVVEALFNVLTKFEDSKTNEWVMKSVLTVASRAQEGLVRIVPKLLACLKSLLLEVSKNPQRPVFNHYMFEVMACSIYYIGKDNPSTIENFEGALMPTLTTILETESCTEFHPYCYQLMCSMLRLRPTITEAYVNLFDKLLHPSLWRDDGTILAISGMFAEYLNKVDVAKFVNKSRLEGMLGIYKELLARRSQDFYAFRILRAVFEHVPQKTLGEYLPQIFFLVFERLKQQKSTQLCVNFIVCISMYVIKNGLEPILRACDEIQNNIFVMVIQSVWLHYARRVEDLTDRRILTVGMIRMITDPAFLSNAALNDTFPHMIQLIVEIFEVNPNKDNKSADEIQQQRIKQLESQGFGAKFVGLAHARYIPSDPTKNMDDPRQLLVSRVASALNNNSQMIASLGKALDPRHVKMFNEYCKQFNVRFGLPTRDA